MLFSTGNLITLGIVVVVLLVYRQLDRDNRSLERVKKFADKLRDELSLHVDRRAEDLQRFGIELDVQQKAAKEALKRLQAVEEGIAARADSMAAVERRIAEYDSVLARLMDMTARVDENLVRIHEEGEFTAGLAKKLEGAEKTMGSIERELPSLRQAFARDAAGALEGFKAELTADVSRRLSETTEILERARTEAEASLERAEEGRRSVDKELGRAFERARVEAGKLEDAAFEKLREGTEAKVARLRETVDEKFGQIGQAAKDKAAETQGLVKAFKAEWKAEAEGLLDSVRLEIGRAAEELGKRLDLADARATEVDGRVEERFTKVDRRAEELAAALSEKVKAALAAQKEDFERRAAESKAATRSAAEELAREAAALRKEAEEAADALRAETAASTAVARAEAERGQGALAEAVSRATAEAASLATRVMAQGEGAAAAALGEVERRLAEYASEVEARFARLESVQVDVGALEAALRASMDRAVRAVEADLEASGRVLDERRARFEEGFTAEAGKLRASMRSLEDELAALKSRAYENVSEKLKVFEDEFFADLKARSDAADARLEAWKSELDASLERLSEAARAERGAAEKAALEELRARIAESRDRVMEQLEASRSRTDAMADGIAAQADMAKDSLAALRASVEADAADARKTVGAWVEGELSRFQVEADGRLKGAERELAERLASLSSLVAAEESRIARVREETARAAAEFSSGHSRAVAEAEARAKAELEGFRARSAALVESLSADYERQRDAWLQKAQAERDRVSKDLASLADRGAELRQDIQSRSADALEGFQRGYEAVLADIAKRQKEAQAEAERKLEDFRDAAQDLARRVDSSRAQALGKVDAEAARLAQSLAEIESRQKTYLADTKLFERADELSARLAGAIEAMKGDLARLDGRKAEIAELEAQLGRVKRLEDEVNQKVTRFLAEKRRVDALEEDFGRLAGVAQGVDRKLEELTGQGDALTEAQASIRKVFELAAESDARYERLEKKAAVLDATTEAVDKNFQTVQGLERIVAAIGAELKRMPERVTEIRKDVDDLAAGRERLDDAVRKLGELDSILQDAERRVAEAQKVREWLARAETRLEEVNRQAQEQLKLLSTLLKDEGAKPRDRGAPPSSVQDTVRKLSRQGWNPDEIARAVKISRGEVELILELGGKA